MDPNPVLNIIGEKVALGPMTRDLLPLHQRWINDFATMRTYHVPRSYSMESFISKWDTLGTQDRQISFAINEYPALRPNGRTGLTDLDIRSSYAEFDLFIGEPDARGKGYGTEATRLMLDYSFTALGLHSVSLTVFAFNLAGRRAYEKAGFRVSGRQRERAWMGGQYWDVIYKDCLAKEFSGTVLGKIFVPDNQRP